MAKAEQPQPGWVETAKNVVGALTDHWKVTAFLLAIIGLFYGWGELRKSQNAKGRALAPLGSIIRRTVRFAIKEDNTPLITKPAKFAEKVPWLTGKRLYLFGFPLFFIAALLKVPFASFVAIFIALVLFSRSRKFMRMRHGILMQMFNVANGECRYDRGAALNPWSYINIQSWQSPTIPGTTVVTYPASYQSEEMKTREKFERQFNGTVSDQNSWTYTWESSKNRVVCQPSSFLPTMATYPGPGPDWDKIPIGVSAGGGHAQWDVKTFPHALVCGPTGTGKNLTLAIQIPTTEGSKQVGDIQVGDTIFGEDGNPTKVVALSPIVRDHETFEVEFSDGTVITADADHLWWTETRGARESRWSAVKRPAGRAPLLSGEQIARLDLELAKADPDSEITIRDAAAIVGVEPTTPWIRELAAHAGQVGEVQFDVTQNYSAQVVESMQWVRRWGALDAWSALAVKKCRNKNWKYEYLRPRFAELAATTASGLMLSASEVGELLGIPRVKAIDLMKQSGALCVKNRELLEQHVPESTVVKKSTWTATFPAATLLSLMIEHGRRTPYDQRAKRVLGGTRTTKEILETLRTSGGHANHSVPVAKALVLPEADLPIKPYTFGAWLGDGFSWGAQVCGIDHEVARWMEKDGYDLSEYVDPSLSSIGEPRHADFRVWTVHGIRKHLSALGVLKKDKSEGLTKFIPVEYLRASIEQRRDLLAGLLDTDGTVDPQGTVSITQVNPRLARGIFELVNSLGYKGSIREGRATLNGVDHGPMWTVEFAAEVSPFNLSRKSTTFAERSRWSAERNSRRWIVDVRPVASVPMRCIRVDNESHLFLVGDSFVATHNSVLQRNILFHTLAHDDHWRIVGIDPKRVEMSWLSEYESVLRVASELEDAVDVLRMLKMEMHRRYKEMEAEKVNIFTNLQDPPPAVLLMIDETTILLAPEKIKSDEGKIRDELHAEAGMIIGELGRLARAAGIHVIACMQRPDAEFLKGETKANFDCRIVAGRTDTTPSMMILDSEAATRLPLIKGRGMIRLGGQMQTFQGFYAEPDWYDEFLQHRAAKESGDGGDVGSEADHTPQKKRRGIKVPALPSGDSKPSGGLLGRLKAKAATPPAGADRGLDGEGSEIASEVSVAEAQQVAEGLVSDVFDDVAGREQSVESHDEPVEDEQPVRPDLEDTPAVPVVEEELVPAEMIADASELEPTEAEVEDLDGQNGWPAAQVPVGVDDETDPAPDLSAEPIPTSEPTPAPTLPSAPAVSLPISPPGGLPIRPGGGLPTAPPVVAAPVLADPAPEPVTIPAPSVAAPVAANSDGDWWVHADGPSTDVDGAEPTPEPQPQTVVAVVRPSFGLPSPLDDPEPPSAPRGGLPVRPGS